MDVELRPEPSAQAPAPTPAKPPVYGGGPKDADVSAALVEAKEPRAPSQSGDVASSSGSSRARALGYLALGVGGGGLLVGALLRLARSTQTRGARRGLSRGELSEQRPELDTFHRLATVSTTALIAGGAVATTGIVLFTTRSDEPRRRARTVTPVLGLGFVGAIGAFE